MHVRDLGCQHLNRFNDAVNGCGAESIALEERRLSEGVRVHCQQIVEAVFQFFEVTQRQREDICWG